MEDRQSLSLGGVEVPRIGLGTWQIAGRRCVEAVADALALGYRHLDTAAVYDNEAEVGEGMRRSGVARGEIFLTTKVWYDQVGSDAVRRSAEESLRRLGSEYLDLLLFHWPNPRVPPGRVVEWLQDAREAGLTRQIGLSNFPPGALREALRAGSLFCNQVEYHPLLGQGELLALAREEDLMLAAYAPFGHGEVLREPLLAEIGAGHGKSAAQVALRWLLDQPQVVVLPKAASRRNRLANLDVWDFELADDERARIDALPKDRRRFDPPWAPDWSR